jgi:ATPase family AAA domain-containing protein 3A/B
VYGEVSQLEHILSASSDGDAELRMREAAAKAEIAKNEMEMEILRAKNEEEYAEAMRASEEEQIRRSEELTLERLKREDEAARVRTEKLLKAKFEASQRIEQTRAEAAEAVALIEHEQKLLLQKAAEEMKVKTAKAVAKAKAEAERANEDVHLRRLQAESEQRRKRNIAAINAVFTHLSTSLSEAAKNPKQVLVFIGYICLLTSAIFFAREASRLIRSIIEATIGKPQLIRETTRKNFPWSLFSYFGQLISCLIPWTNKTGSSLSIEEAFDDLILPDELKERVMDLAYSARNARRHNAPFRHVLLYGPPGTGKTSKCSNCYCCVMCEESISHLLFIYQWWQRSWPK